MNKMRDKNDTAARVEAIDGDVTALLAELGAQPLSARSLLLSYLLGTHPPEASAARLVDFGSLFGLRPGTVRTAASRMVAAGEATLDDGTYRLAGRLLDRQRLQDQGQLDPVDEWDGTWWTAVATTDDRTATDRRHRRADMIDARLGELRPGVWMRPADTPGPAAGDDLVVTRGSLHDLDPAMLAARLWDLPEVEARSARLDVVLARLGQLLIDPTVDAEQRGRLLARTFEVSAVCVRHLRIEPRLPRPVAEMPATRRLRRNYRDVNRDFRRVLAEHL